MFIERFVWLLCRNLSHVSSSIIEENYGTLGALTIRDIIEKLCVAFAL